MNLFRHHPGCPYPADHPPFPGGAGTCSAGYYYSYSDCVIIPTWEFKAVVPAEGSEAKQIRRRVAALVDAEELRVAAVRAFNGLPYRPWPFFNCIREALNG